MGILARFFGDRQEQALPLYNAAVAVAREAHWYVEGAVPDTVDGRFDMIAAVLSIILLRLESEPGGAQPAAHLAERFVDDMDRQLREIGIGDITVGKHVGKMMAALGGRLGAYRDALASGDIRPALGKNLYRGEPVPPAALAHVAERLAALRDRLAGVPLVRLTEGELA